jgi:hypothetical protein
VRLQTPAGVRQMLSVNVVSGFLHGRRGCARISILPAGGVHLHTLRVRTMSAPYQRTAFFIYT